MTTVLNSPTSFAEQALRGFTLAHQDLVLAVPGGVVRADCPPAPSVAVVTGGGSGHYPAFCGWVGSGLADGAAVGDVFASPAAEQICTVARAADNGGGVLLVYGNYAGDVLNFTQAQHRLEAGGLHVRNLPVTDDITSAPASERRRRRGTAGDLVVLKVAGGAAAAGGYLDAVTELAARANDRTFSFGIAFAGCTLPGADRPLFELPAGRMGVGMGVHGEPGISETPVATAAELAQTLVSGLLAERPAGAGHRVLALLNGLGSTGHEELHVLWGEVYDRLVAAGLELVEPEVDELITSLDMAGLSLTLCWLDEELETAWRAPCRTAAFSRGSAHAGGPRREVAVTRGADPADPADLADLADRAAAGGSSPGSAAQAVIAAGLADAVLAALVEAETDLGSLDSFAGDGDHGLGMVRGARAAARRAAAAAAAGWGLPDTLVAAGDAWAAAGGGTSGALWGAAIRACGLALPRTGAADATALVDALAAARDEIVRIGGASVGDKTMLDALDPFVRTLAVEWSGLPAPSRPGWEHAVQAAQRGADATSAVVARRGRARPLGERSLGHPDPGAVSTTLVLRALGEAAPGMPS